MTDKNLLNDKSGKFKLGAEGVGWVCFAVLLVSFSIYISQIA